MNTTIGGHDPYSFMPPPRDERVALRLSTIAKGSKKMNSFNYLYRTAIWVAIDPTASDLTLVGARSSRSVRLTSGADASGRNSGQAGGLQQG